MKPHNLNNANPIPDFQSFYLFGSEDCPQKILVYANAHPKVGDKYAEAFLMEGGLYSFIKH